MKTLEMATDLIWINRDISQRRLTLEEDFFIYDFDQTWASTALGFGGVGGSALTTARTYVLVPKVGEKAYVYFGNSFAYECVICDSFWDDVKNHSMVEVMRSERYK